MKKMLSVMLIFAMLITLCMPANAATPANTKISYDMVKSKSAVASVKQKDAPSEVLDLLSKHGAKIKEDTVIEVLRLEDSEDKVICVVNIENDQVEKDVLLPLMEDENNTIRVDNSVASFLLETYDSVKTGSGPPEGWVDGYIVHGTATAEVVYISGLGELLRPYACSFYYERSSDVAINDVTVNYVVGGSKYRVSDGQWIEGDFSHTVTAHEMNPIEGMEYSGVNYFEDGYGIDIASGGIPLGEYLFFYLTADGEYINYSVGI